jgi:hypothetical protein
MWGNRRFAPHAFYGRDRLAAVSAFFLFGEKSLPALFATPVLAGMALAGKRRGFCRLIRWPVVIGFPTALR